MTTLASLLDVRLEIETGSTTRPFPVADIDSAAFWAGLRDHRLLITRCDDCGNWIHPPMAGCPNCLSMNVSPHEASGRGTLYSFTVVNREFAPGVKPPYVVGLVDLEEQAGLRLLTNIVNATVRDLYIAMPVQVAYYDMPEASLAFFEPFTDGAT
jgi:uncharacterized OB-fold protein